MESFIFHLFLLKALFVLITGFSTYLRQFPAGENVQIAGNIVGYRSLLTTLQCTLVATQYPYGLSAHFCHCDQLVLAPLYYLVQFWFKTNQHFHLSRFYSFTEQLTFFFFFFCAFLLTDDERIACKKQFKIVFHNRTLFYKY